MQEHIAEAQWRISGELGFSVGRGGGVTSTSKNMGAFGTALSQASTSTFMEDKVAYAGLNGHKMTKEQAISGNLSLT